jgi:O-antigen chain-terminating methyltransferase
LFYCSRTHALVAGALKPIRRFSATSHQAAAQVLAGKRRYFEIDGGLVKITAQFDENVGPETLRDLKEEMRHEAAMLHDLAGTAVQVPTVVEFADAPNEVLLARTVFAGELLSECLATMPPADRVHAVRQVLAQLVELEGLGLFHSDLRTWNVIWDPQTTSVHLIDHGSIVDKPTDVSWPFDAYYSFAVFAVAVLQAAEDQTGLEALRVPAAPTLDDLTPEGTRIISSVLNAKPNGRFFQALDRSIATTQHEGTDEAPLSAAWLLRLGSALGEDLARRRAELTSLHALYDSLESGHHHLERQYADALHSYEGLHTTYEQTVAAYEARNRDYEEAVESWARSNALFLAASDDVRRSREELVALRDSRAQLEAALRASESRALELDRHVQELRRTLSWRITRPLRGIRRVQRRVMQLLRR